MHNTQRLLAAWLVVLIANAFFAQPLLAQINLGAAVLTPVHKPDFAPYQFTRSADGGMWALFKHYEGDTLAKLDRTGALISSKLLPSRADPQLFADGNDVIVSGKINGTCELRRFN